MFIKFHDSDGHICPLNILVTRFCIRVLGDKIKQGNKNPLNIYICFPVFLSILSLFTFSERS
jgi:hypothetical protein